MGKALLFSLPRGARRVPCRGCGALIVWAATTNPEGTHVGRWIPLDWASRRRVADGRMAAEAHWARCPEAERFRPAPPRNPTPSMFE